MRKLGITRFRHIFFAMALVLAGPSNFIVSPSMAKPPAKSEVPKAEDKGTKLIMLGTGGGPMERSDRAQASALLVVDGRAYLIDAGSGAVMRLAQVGYSSTDVGTVFLTHLHLDHVADLSALIGLNWASSQRSRMQILGPPGTRKFVDSAVEHLRIPEELYAALYPPTTAPLCDVTQGIDVTAGDEAQKIFEDDRLRVFAVRNSHYHILGSHSFSFGKPASYSYRFETAEKVIVFTGDTGPSDALVKFASDADILVSEVIDLDATEKFIRRSYDGPDEALSLLLAHQEQQHLTPASVGRLAGRANAKLVVLYHLAPGMDQRSDILNYTRGMKDFYSGPVVVANDLSQY